MKNISKGAQIQQYFLLYLYIFYHLLKHNIQYIFNIQFKFDYFPQNPKNFFKHFDKTTSKVQSDKQLSFYFQYFRLWTSFSLYQLTLHSIKMINTERKEELKNKLNVQIPTIQQNSSIKRTSLNALYSTPCTEGFLGMSEDDEVYSPTFQGVKTVKSAVTDQSLLGFSFGEHFLDQMSQILKEDTDKNKQPIFGLPCVQCDSLDFGSKEKDIDQTKTKRALTKISQFLKNTKKQVSDLQTNLKNYQQEFTAQLSKWTNYFLMIIKGLHENNNQSKQKQSIKIQQILQQLCRANQRQKSYEMRIQAQDRIISELTQQLTKQKHKIQQLMSHLQHKSVQNMNLLQENTKLNTNLNKFMCLVNQVSINNQQVRRKNTVSYQNNIIDQDTFNTQFKNKQNEIFNRVMRNNSLTTVTSDLITDSLHNIYQSNSSEDDYMMISPISPKSPQSPFQDSLRINSPLPCSSIALQFSNIEPAIDDKFLLSSNTSGKSTLCSGTISKNYQHSASFSSTSTSHQSLKEKHKILGKIQKLKEDIKSDIQDMKRNSNQLNKESLQQF